jgi:serine/threonine protein kinase/Tfp pilus assembly protein PilF
MQTDLQQDVMTVSDDVSRLMSQLLREAEGAASQGREVDAKGVLAQHPHLWHEKTFVMELAYEEFLQQRRQGSGPTTEVFCDRFAPYRSTLQRLLALHQIVENNPSLLDEDFPSWPQPGETWLGLALLEELGRGAFSRVFLASEACLGGRKVVVKVSRGAAEEAQLLGPLEHPHIVPAYAVRHDEASGLSAILMPYRGRYTLEDLKDGRIELSQESCRERFPPLGESRGCIPPALVLKLARQIASALDAAHQRGVIHGDLKPSNVLIDQSGNACVLDFNLATSTATAGPQRGGTLPYMGPEQLRSVADPAAATPHDPRSDLFALGVMLCELLTRRHPYAADFADLCHRPLAELAGELLVRQKAFLPGLRLPGLEPGAARLLRSCLALEIDERVESAARLKALLDRRLRPWAAGERWAYANPLKTSAGLAGLLATLLGAGVLFGNLMADPGSTEVSSLVADLQADALPPEPEPEVQVLELEPPTDSQASLAAYEAGMAAVQAGDLKTARSHFDRSIEFDPSQINARLAKAYTLQLGGENNLALQQYAEIEQQGDHPLRLAGEAYCHARLNNQEWAAAAGRAALIHAERTAALLNNTAFSLMRQDDYAAAHELLDEAVALDPNSSVVHLNRAFLLAGQAAKNQKGVPDEALEAIQTAVRLDPENAGLHLEAARLIARSLPTDAADISPLIEQLRHALRLGWDSNHLRSDFFFRAFSPRDEFQQLLQESWKPSSDTRGAEHLIAPFRLNDLKSPNSLLANE